MHDLEDGAGGTPGDGAEESDQGAEESDQDLVDPTDVVGRRVAGWLVDAALVATSALLVLLLLGDSFERPGSEIGFEVRRVGSDTAVFFRSTVAVVHAWEWAVAALVALVVALLLLVALPGRRGWTPGLLAADLRLVDAEGEHTGLGRSLVRFVGWVIDLLPGVPLVGFGAMSLGRHHQRVGDHMASTYVVDRAFTGRPPTEPALAPADATAPTVVDDDTVAVGSVSTGAEVSDQATVRRGVGRRGRPPADGAEGYEPADQAVAGTSPSARAATSATSTTEEPEGDADQQEAPPAGVVADQPMWDRRHQRYVMWHSDSGRWARYDDDGGTWRPL